MEKAIKRWSPLFVLPTLLAFTIGFIIPFFEGLYLSFCQFTTVKNAKFTGFGNYKKIFSDLTILSSFKFTVLFAVASIVLNLKNRLDLWPLTLAAPAAVFLFMVAAVFFIDRISEKLAVAKIVKPMIGIR